MLRKAGRLWEYKEICAMLKLIVIGIKKHIDSRSNEIVYITYKKTVKIYTKKYSNVV